MDSKLDDIIEKVARHQLDEKILKVPRETLFETFTDYLRQSDSGRWKLRALFTTAGLVEPAHDVGPGLSGAGGVTKELYTLFFQECLKPERKMFEGSGRERLPIRTDEAIRRRWFFCLGKAIAMSLISGGPGFPYIRKCCWSFVTDTTLDELECVHDNLPRKLQDVLRRIDNASSDQEIKATIESPDVRRTLDEINWPNSRTVKLADKLAFTQEVIQFYLYDCRQEAYEQLKTGLNTLKFLDKTKHCPELRTCLVFDKNTHAQRVVTSEYMCKKLLPRLSELKARNSNEEIVKQTASLCLLEMTDEQAIDLYQFITSMRDLPLKECDIEVAFNHQKLEDKLPRSITCISMLLLPLGNQSQKEFIYSFKTALEYARVGFGRM